MKKKLRRLSVYDGMNRMGGLVIREASGKEPVVAATDAAGKALGRFKTEKAAAEAVVRSYRTHVAGAAK